jgi:hypothetical protein
MDKKFVPLKDRAYMESKGFQYREINDGARNGLIIDNFPINEGKFNVKESTLLIILPNGYSDVPPDMFYFNPELKLTSTNNYPAAADVFENYFDIKWQRWSRHFDKNHWRSGIDGIESYIQRVITALKTA